MDLSRSFRWVADDLRNLGGSSTVLICLGALVLRFYRLTADSLWLDEVYTVVAWPQKGLRGLFFDPEPHPPLYFVLSNEWLSVFGQSPLAARSLSALFGVGTVLAVIYAGRVVCDRETGVIAGGMVAVSPTFVHFSQTARMYSLWAALTVVSMTALVARLDWDERSGPLYVAGTVAMLYTHAFSVFVVAAQNVYYLLAYPLDAGVDWRDLRGWLRLQATVGALSVPVAAKYAGIVLETTTNGGSTISWVTAPALSDLVRTVLSFGGYLIYYPHVVVGGLSRTLSVGVVAVLLSLSAYGVWANRSDLRVGATGRAPLVLVAWALVPLLLPIVISYAVPIYTRRSVHVVAIPLYLLAAVGLSSLSESSWSLPTGSLRTVVALALLVSLLASTGMYYDTDSSENWEGAVTYVERHEAPGDVVVATPSYASRPVEYYYDGESRRVITWTHGRSVGSLPDTERIWLVSRYPDQGEGLRQALDAEWHVRRDEQFGHVRVSLFVANETG